MKIITKKLKSGSVITSAIKDNGNSITFNSKGMNKAQIIDYAENRLDYAPIKKINLTSIIDKYERINM